MHDVHANFRRRVRVRRSSGARVPETAYRISRLCARSPFQFWTLASQDGARHFEAKRPLSACNDSPFAIGNIVAESGVSGSPTDDEGGDCGEALMAIRRGRRDGPLRCLPALQHCTRTICIHQLRARGWRSGDAGDRWRRIRTWYVGRNQRCGVEAGVDNGTPAARRVASARSGQLSARAPSLASGRCALRGDRRRAGICGSRRTSRSRRIRRSTWSAGSCRPRWPGWSCRTRWTCRATGP